MDHIVTLRVVLRDVEHDDPRESAETVVQEITDRLLSPPDYVELLQAEQGRDPR